jgi:1-acyl-sn-glycerol-3-phosphate acyltransferase
MNCIPLDRKSGDVIAIKTALRLLKDGKCAMIYPEGTRSGNDSMGEPLLGRGMLVCKRKAPVIPCRLFGTFEIMNRNAIFSIETKRPPWYLGNPFCEKIISYHPVPAVNTN